MVKNELMEALEHVADDGRILVRVSILGLDVYLDVEECSAHKHEIILEAKNEY